MTNDSKASGDLNLYPDEPAGVRRRRRRAPRPAHLPPFDPGHATRISDRVEASRPVVVAPAPAPSFGAGANPALRFHQLRSDRHAPTRAARTDHVDVADTNSEPDTGG